MSNTNSYQAPSRVGDIAEHPQAFMLAERATRLGATSLDGIIFIIPLFALALPLILMNMQNVPDEPWMG